jgi:hypothetical protein
MQTCAPVSVCGEISPHTTTSGRRGTAVFDAVVQTNYIIPSRAGAACCATGAPRCAPSVPGAGRRRHVAALFGLFLVFVEVLLFSISDFDQERN